MSRLALRLVLALTLILNGISAPWAMADAGAGRCRMPERRHAMQAVTPGTAVPRRRRRNTTMGCQLPDAE
jgi:hypothetical protein